jgi:C4-dicarboxylate-specific signal transduction histidine kinase
MINSLKLNLEKDHLLHELKNAQSHMIQSTKMSALNEMAGGIAHEINNPLAIILGHNQIARQHLETGADSKIVLKHIDKIDSTISRIVKIINSLRGFAQEGTGSYEQVEVQDLISGVLTMCQSRFKKNNVELILPQIPEDLVINCQKSEMSQVLFSILGNALDAALMNKNERWVKLEFEENEGHIIFSVIDSGPGISQDIKDKIWQPFFTTKEVGKGTGLGLSTSKGVLEIHGGSLVLDEHSANTRFVITIPKQIKFSVKIAS